MNRFFCFALAGSMFIAHAASTAAIYHAPVSDRYGFSGEDVGIRREWADDFTAPSSATINQVVWWGGGSSPGNDAFVVRFFADTSGKPGQQLFEATLGNGSPTLSGGILGGSDPGYIYRAMLNSPFQVSPNQRYWISIVNTANASWMWQTSNENLLDGILRRNVGEPWGEPYGDDVAFALNEVPEPETRFMLVTAMVVALGLRRKSSDSLLKRLRSWQNKRGEAYP